MGSSFSAAAAADRSPWGRQRDVAAADVILDLADVAIGFGEAALRCKPTRRFRHQPPQRQDQQSREGAEQEQRSPAERRHDPGAEKPGGGEADAEDHLVEEKEATALMRLGQFADVAGRDGNLAGEADALDRAKSQKRPIVPRHAASEAGD